MQFVVDRADYKKAIIALNQALCLDPVNGPLPAPPGVVGT
jgi:hypothetical protein